MSNSLHVADNYKFIRLFYYSVLMKGYKVYHCALSTVPFRVYRSFTTIFHKYLYNIAINIYYTLPYYADIMLNAFNDPLCSKLCWHNRRVPNHIVFRTNAG